MPVLYPRDFHRKIFRPPKSEISLTFCSSVGSTLLAFRRVFSFQLRTDSDSKVRYLCVINHSGDFQNIQLYQALVVDTPRTIRLPRIVMLLRNATSKVLSLILKTPCHRDDIISGGYRSRSESPWGVYSLISIILSLLDKSTETLPNLRAKFPLQTEGFFRVFSCCTSDRVYPCGFKNRIWT